MHMSRLALSGHRTFDGGCLPLNAKQTLRCGSTAIAHDTAGMTFILERMLYAVFSGAEHCAAPVSEKDCG